MSGGWSEYRVSADGTHHVRNARPAYAHRFLEVLSFHPPGLAPVRDDSGAYHITPDGRPAYGTRHLRTFGFYEGVAAVTSPEGWFHVLPDGTPLYADRYAWCGNFQEGSCAVRQGDDRYFHVTARGVPAYRERYRYAGDFKDGFAVVQGDDGRHTHVDADGNLVHGRWFQDLDVFHKGYARACDGEGWHHVDLGGEPLYGARFGSVEPFYNGQARVEGPDGSLSVIDECGETLVSLRRGLKTPLEELSADMVGFWKTQTIRAAVELGVFEALPASLDELEKAVQSADSVVARLMRALTELALVRLEEGTYHPTGKGALLQRAHLYSLSDAALLWGGETYSAWARASETLRTDRPAFDSLYGESFFDWLRDRPEDSEACHGAFAAYARHDYQALARSVDFGVHEMILDAGGGTGELSFALLHSFPGLTSVVMDRPDVIGMARTPSDVQDRCRFVEGDLFQRWPARAEAVVLARVLHDWPDEDAVRILHRAREALPGDGKLYVVEMLLDDASGAGGLLDLNMLVMTGGAERTREQYGELLGRAGFELLDVTPTGSVSSVLRARVP